MKSCDEMVESLLGRRQEYIERQKRKSITRKIRKRKRRRRKIKERTRGTRTT